MHVSCLLTVFENDLPATPSVALKRTLQDSAAFDPAERRLCTRKSCALNREFRLSGGFCGLVVWLDYYIRVERTLFLR